MLSNSLVKTKHQLKVTDVSAPTLTNCVTAIRYLLNHSSSYGLPKTFIGDMPRILVRFGCKVVQIKVSEIKLGDLLFFKSDSFNLPYFKRQYISHIAIGLQGAQIFHSTSYRNGGSLEDLSNPVDLYAQDLMYRSVDDPPLFLRYIDPRNLKLREETGTDLIPFPIPKTMPKIEQNGLQTENIESEYAFK